MSETPSIVVIGLGNDYRSDDRAGLLIARLVGVRVSTGIRIVEGVADGAALVEAWQGAQLAFVVDCVSSKAQPGTIFRFDTATERIPGDVFTTWSTHVFDLVKAIELAETLRRLPGKLIIYGIEGRGFAPGTRLSTPVIDGVEEVARRIIRDIEASRLAAFEAGDERVAPTIRL